MKRYISFTLFIITALSFFCLSGCSNGVKVQNKGSHYYMTVDYTKGKSHYDTGRLIGEALHKGVDNFEKIYDNFIALTAREYGYPEKPGGTPEEHYTLFMSRVNDLKALLPEEIKAEIDGVAGTLSGGDKDTMGDGKLSINEYYFINLIVETSENSECCAVSAFGDASESGNTITARVMDWYIDTDKKEIEHLFGITEYRYKDFTIHSVGVIGHLGLISGVRSNGIYGAILFSRNNTPYSSTGKHSYSMEFRYAMEKYSSIDEIANYMKSAERNYTMNHNIFLSDKSKSIVLENDLQGGPGAARGIRTWNSRLNNNVQWGFENRIACVNSFILYGNDDNHTTVPGNRNRWLEILKLMSEKKKPLSYNDIREIITYYPGKQPADFDAGGLYTEWSKQIMIFQPEEMTFDIFFSPKTGKLPSEPVFEKIKLKK
ncbi:MAG TPA: C45 family autoproteolytic acyltransferase/hydrolase [Spirochaetota bacterium]|nr:C45 family autoproteolytic acyltransferase/hydrolase [Spirochaetota bacterium]